MFCEVPSVETLVAHRDRHASCPRCTDGGQNISLNLCVLNRGKTLQTLTSLSHVYVAADLTYVVSESSHVSDVNVSIFIDTCR